MRLFEYDQKTENAELYETLHNLIERWEYEVVEFKEAKLPNWTVSILTKVLTKRSDQARIT